MTDGKIELNPTNVQFGWIPGDQGVTAMVLSKNTAALLIKDLVEDLTATGIAKLVLRGSDGQFYVFHVK